MSVNGLIATAILLLTTVLVSGQKLQLRLEQGPMSVSVKENDEAVLVCKFSGAAKECVWSKDGEITIVQEPYHYAGSPETGDCSIRISRVELARDDGLWKCQFPRFGNNPAVSSPEAKLTVLVPPQDPALLFNGEPVEIGGTLPIENLADNVTLVCVSKNGNPATQLYWMIDNERREGNSRNESVLANGSSRLYNTESQLLFNSIGTQLRGGTQVKCVAEHPTYQGRLHESYGYFQVHQNTTQVTASVDGSSSTNVDARPYEKITLYCTADGIPTPSYTWSFQPHGADTWEVYGHQQNLTITAAGGRFICRAGNEYNTDLVQSSEEITVDVKEQKMNPANGALYVSLSIVVLVLTATVNGFNLFII